MKELDKFSVVLELLVECCRQGNPARCVRLAPMLRAASVRAHLDWRGRLQSTTISIY